MVHTPMMNIAAISVGQEAIDRHFADRARTVLAIKRTMNPGFAGIDNDLYYRDQTLMLFGDAKAVVGQVVDELKKAAVAA